MPDGFGSYLASFPCDTCKRAKFDDYGWFHCKYGEPVYFYDGDALLSFNPLNDPIIERMNHPFRQVRRAPHERKRSECLMYEKEGACDA